MNIIIRREEEKDYRKVEELIRDSFWNVYHPGALEHYVMHGFRTAESFVPELDLVMEKDGELIGQVMYARSELKGLDGTVRPCMTFGPICIANPYKRQGYGKMLLEESMRRAAELDAGVLCITGNILFYGKSGFVVASTLGIGYEEAEEGDTVVPYFLAKELKEGYVRDYPCTFREPEPYFICEKDPEGFAAFDATFPPMEKQVLPGQLNH